MEKNPKDHIQSNEKAKSQTQKVENEREILPLSHEGLSHPAAVHLHFTYAISHGKALQSRRVQGEAPRQAAQVSRVAYRIHPPAGALTPQKGPKEGELEELRDDSHKKVLRVDVFDGASRFEQFPHVLWRVQAQKAF